MVESNGINLGHGADADTVAENWAKIADFAGAKHYTMGGEQSEQFIGAAAEQARQSLGNRLPESSRAAVKDP